MLGILAVLDFQHNPLAANFAYLLFVKYFDYRPVTSYAI
jgi:hypothetical protein